MDSASKRKKVPQTGTGPATGSMSQPFPPEMKAVIDNIWRIFQCTIRTHGQVSIAVESGLSTVQNPPVEIIAVDSVEWFVIDNVRKEILLLNVASHRIPKYIRVRRDKLGYTTINHRVPTTNNGPHQWAHYVGVVCYLVMNFLSSGFSLRQAIAYIEANKAAPQFAQLTEKLQSRITNSILRIGLTWEQAENLEETNENVTTGQYLFKPVVPELEQLCRMPHVYPQVIYYILRPLPTLSYIEQLHASSKAASDPLGVHHTINVAADEQAAVGGIHALPSQLVRSEVAKFLQNKQLSRLARTSKTFQQHVQHAKFPPLAVTRHLITYAPYRVIERAVNQSGAISFANFSLGLPITISSEYSAMFDEKCEKIFGNPSFDVAKIKRLNLGDHKSAWKWVDTWLKSDKFCPSKLQMLVVSTYPLQVDADARALALSIAKTLTTGKFSELNTVSIRTPIDIKITAATGRFTTVGVWYSMLADLPKGSLQHMALHLTVKSTIDRESPVEDYFIKGVKRHASSLRSLRVFVKDSFVTNGHLAQCFMLRHLELIGFGLNDTALIELVTSYLGTNSCANLAHFAMDFGTITDVKYLVPFGDALANSNIEVLSLGAGFDVTTNPAGLIFSHQKMGLLASIQNKAFLMGRIVRMKRLRQLQLRSDLFLSDNALILLAASCAKLGNGLRLIQITSGLGLGFAGMHALLDAQMKRVFLMDVKSLIVVLKNEGSDIIRSPGGAELETPPVAKYIQMMNGLFNSTTDIVVPVVMRLVGHYNDI
jgi:hypothetical protein